MYAFLSRLVIYEDSEFKKTALNYLFSYKKIIRIRFTEKH